MKQPRERRDDQPAFVLHTYPYRETSVIVEALTAAYGRVAMVARGARRARSELRGVLQAFQPLTREADTGRPIDPAERYYYAFDLGPRTTAAEPGRRYPQIRGATLLALAEHDYSAPEAAAEAKRLMREVLDHYLEQRAIVSRRVVRDLQALENGDNGANAGNTDHD